MRIFLFLLRTIVSFIVGLVLAFALVIGVELFSNVVHPLPSDFEGTQEEICLHVERYPNWVLGIVVIAWGAIAAIATWTARKIGNVFSSASLGILLIAGVGMNLSMLPYPLWFNVVLLPVILGAIALGGRPWIPQSTVPANVSQA